MVVTVLVIQLHLLLSCLILLMGCTKLWHSYSLWSFKIHTIFHPPCKFDGKKFPSIIQGRKIYHCGVLHNSQQKYWVIFSWACGNILEWNLAQNTIIFIQWIHLIIASAKCQTFCLNLILIWQVVSDTTMKYSPDVYLKHPMGSAQGSHTHHVRTMDGKDSWLFWKIMVA